MEKFDVGSTVEALTNNDWLEGTVTSVDDSVRSCIKLDIKFEDGATDTVSLGKVVLPWPKGKRDRLDSRGRSRSRSRSKNRSRSRSRSRGERDRSSDRSRTPDRRDWSYYKGVRQSDLLEKWRNQEKEKALSSGRDGRKADGYVPNVFRPVPRSGDGKRGLSAAEAAEEAALTAEMEAKARREKEKDAQMAEIVAKYSGAGGESTTTKADTDADVVRLG